MANKVYAFTNIRYSDPKDPGSEVVEYEPGEDITGKFDDDTLRQFLAQGTAALYDRTKTREESAQDVAELHEERDQLRDQVLELQRQLAQQTAARELAEQRATNADTAPKQERPAPTSNQLGLGTANATDPTAPSTSTVAQPPPDTGAKPSAPAEPKPNPTKQDGTA